MYIVYTVYIVHTVCIVCYVYIVCTVHCVHYDIVCCVHSALCSLYIA